MATHVLLTVDTELVWRHFAAGLGWRENLARSVDAAGVGVPFKLAMMARHGLKACFFVDPMPALHYGIEPIRRMIDPILAAGQEVQLHLHPFWCGANEERVFELAGLSRERQRDLIGAGRDLLVQAGAPPPIAFRSGSYAADTATLAALADLGIRYDSSHNGAHHPFPSALPLDPSLIDPVEEGGVIEVPVTQIALTGGGLRHLQLCAVSAREMRAALDHAAHHRHPLTTIVSHSFELATRDGLRPNRVNQRRFESLCRFLECNRERLPTAHFRDLKAIAGPPGSPLLPANLPREMGRMAEQIWANARYERSPAALTAIAGSSLAGLSLAAALAVD